MIDVVPAPDAADLWLAQQDPPPEDELDNVYSDGYNGLSPYSFYEGFGVPTDIDVAAAGRWLGAAVRFITDMRCEPLDGIVLARRDDLRGRWYYVELDELLKPHGLQRGEAKDIRRVWINAEFLYVEVVDNAA